MVLRRITNAEIFFVVFVFSELIDGMFLKKKWKNGVGGVFLEW